MRDAVIFITAYWLGHIALFGILIHDWPPLFNIAFGLVFLCIAYLLTMILAELM